MVSKLEPSWDGLPFHFKKSVVGYLDFESKCHLRICSESDLILVDSCPMSISKIGFFIGKNQATFYFTPESKIMAKRFYSDSKFTYHDLVHDFVRFTSHPRTLVEELSIEFSDVEKSNYLLEEIQKSIEKRKINVKKLLWYTCPNNHYATKFIHILNPKTLKSIRFGNVSDSLETINELMETEQWKSSEELISVSLLPVGIDVEKFLGIRKVNIHLRKEDFLVERIQNFVVKYLHSNHPVGSYFSITTNSMENDVENDKGYKHIWIGDKKVIWNELTHISIPSSSNFLCIGRSLGGIRGLVRDKNNPIEYFKL